MPQGISEKQGKVGVLRENTRIAPAAPARLMEAQDVPANGNTAGGLRARPVIAVPALEGIKGAVIKQAEKPKKVEIEGPLSKRKVLRHYVPSFPAWARDSGILEASVSLKFYVDNSGRVMHDTSVEKSSGYGALDRLAADAIKRWRFEPIAGGISRQWGVITFRFVTD